MILATWIPLKGSGIICLGYCLDLRKQAIWINSSITTFDCNVENSFYFIGKKQSKGKKRIQLCTFLCIYLLLRTNIVYGVLYLFTTLSPVRARVDIACDIDTVKSFVLVGVNFTRILFSEIRKGVDPCIHFYVWWDEIKFHSSRGLSLVEDSTKYLKRYN